MKLHEEVKKLLEDIGLPQTVIARRLGYSSQTLNRVLNGTQKPGPDLISKLEVIRTQLRGIKATGT